MPDGAKEFFSPGSIATFTGATAAVWVLANTYRFLFKRNSMPVLFIISIAVAVIGAVSSHTATDLWSWLLTGLNGCLLFCTAAGAQETIASRAPATPPGDAALAKPTPTFFSSWIH